MAQSDEIEQAVTVELTLPPGLIAALRKRYDALPAADLTMQIVKVLEKALLPRPK